MTSGILLFICLHACVSLYRKCIFYFKRVIEHCKIGVAAQFNRLTVFLLFRQTHIFFNSGFFFLISLKFANECIKLAGKFSCHFIAYDLTLNNLLYATAVHPCNRNLTETKTKTFSSVRN